MRLLWLADVLRSAGLTVHEVSGWRTRGSATWGPIRGITCHHTAGSRTSTDEGEIRVLLNGSSSAPPPIAQLYLSRTGHWWVVGSGMCYHNLVGWAGPNEGLGNANLIGIEAQHSGGDEPWTSTQYNSYVHGVAALVKRLGISVSRVAGHKEHQPGSKSDPTFNMNTFRTRVAEALEDDVTPAELFAAELYNPVTQTNARFGAFIQSINSEAYRGRLAAEAALAAVQGDSSQQILDRINELAAQESQRDSELRALVEQAQNGELDAAEVVRLIGEKLAG